MREGCCGPKLKSWKKGHYLKCELLGSRIKVDVEEKVEVDEESGASGRMML